MMRCLTKNFNNPLLIINICLVSCAEKEDKMNHSKGNQKHLTLSQRIEFEKGLNYIHSFAEITRGNFLPHRKLTSIFSIQKILKLRINWFPASTKA